MKKIIIIILFLFNYPLLTIKAQQGEWTWMNGSDTSNATVFGHCGTQGVFAQDNTPRGHYEACEWTDKQGNFWLFGGNGYCDLWEFKPAINQWAWINGPTTIAQPGVYGTQTIPSPANHPGSRGYGISTWVDTAGNLWLFGGKGIYSDLWKYNIATNEWAWMAGPTTLNDPGHYGTILISDPANNPPARFETSASWADNNNCLWLFGGGNTLGSLSDLWKFDISTNQWTWMKGANIVNQPPVYGIINIPSPTNEPGARWCYAKWKDSQGNFWMFSGAGINTGYRNDMWRFNPTTNEWTWMSGPNTPYDTIGVSGTQCLPSVNNIPKARRESRVCWTRPNDNFVFFGGGTDVIQYNDMWNYNVNTNEWTWMSGSVIPDQPGSYGTILVPSPTNMPSSRSGGVGWTDNSGNLWMFGGSILYYKNDMWRFIPDCTCPYMPMNASVSNFTALPLNGCSPLTVTFNNTSSNSTNYIWSFGDNSYDTTFNPTHIYTHDSTYIVMLITNNNCSANDTSLITIHVSTPLPVITGDSSICSGDTSLLDAGSFAQYHWSTGATTQSIIVTTTNNYIVTVTNGFGCTGTASRAVTVNANAHASFTADTLTGCSPLTVTFINTSSNATSYLWNFGNNDTSILTNPSYIYDSSGIYTITLIAYGAGGCNDTMIRSNYITILSLPVITSSFTAMPLSGCNPLTVSFNNTSTNGTSYLWNFGDNNTSTQNNPAHIYDSSGTFTVNLITTNTSICGVVTDTSTTTITVNPQAHALFYADTLTGCSPFTVHFINNSSNATSYLWDLGNSNTSTASNPSFTYNTSGIYTITLIAYNAGGCNDTMIQTNYITINTLPIVTSSFTQDSVSGCNPLTVHFNITSTNGISYIWNFGDSTILSTFNATHTYISSGTYTVTLITTNSGPCGVVTDTAIKQSLITVDEPITVKSIFTAEPVNGCSPLLVNFSNGSINAATYYWYFGDGGVSSTLNPTHLYDTGTYHVYLIASNSTNRCMNTPDSTGLLITVENCELSIPNTFSPNNDGKNDFFNIITDGYTNYHLLIFNRWGLKVFESIDTKLQWNGKVNNTGGDCTDGTYYYIFTGIDFNKAPYADHGFITLIR